jgi:hypothetical protein
MGAIAWLYELDLPWLDAAAMERAEALTTIADARQRHGSPGPSSVT